LLAAVLACVTLFSLTIPVLAANAPSVWAVPEVEAAGALGLVPDSAVSGGYQTPLSRLGFCEIAVQMTEVFLGAALPCPEKPPFGDTDAAAVSKAHAYGIVNGISATQFAPNDRVTRQEAAVMLVRALTCLEKATDLTLLDRPDSEAFPFGDKARTDVWAIEQVRLVGVNGLMKGYEDNTFRPQATITSEECILLAYRAFKQMTERRGGGEADGPSVPVAPPGSDVPDELAQYAARLLALVNQERAKAGLPPYDGGNAALNAAAALRAKELQTLFSHDRPNGKAWYEVLAEFDVRCSLAGENTATNCPQPEDAVAFWMQSPPHKAHLLHAGFTQMGVGVSVDASGQLFWELLFITPK
jgi:uncharacterized protein YkwD